MATETVFQQINNYANRANPYPLFAKLREKPIWSEPDGIFVVSRYQLIAELLADPRISASGKTDGDQAEDPFRISFIRTDPPEHDRLRSMIMRQFGPPHRPDFIDGLRGDFSQLVNKLLDKVQGRTRIDIVDDYAYPFPVTVICRLLGVPVEDEARFHTWADAIVNELDPHPPAPGEREGMSAQQARSELGHYMAELIEKHRQHPGNDMLSRLATDHGPYGQLSPHELTSTSILLLIAGHETTVNLQTNGMLTLLRYPETLKALRNDPQLVIPLVEELLRFEPPVQIDLQHNTLVDMTVEGVKIPGGSPIYMALAAGNRDSDRFPDPEKFIPTRTDNQHFGFYRGIHYCFGAPLARLEVQTSLNVLAQRLINPRLVTDPPLYRHSPILRGPRHLLVDIDGIKPEHFDTTAS